MSDSRLEKFIYAICSMDVSDLPVPLSRIEKLWNCLITGETPDFEPLSRNEKYLMAMLDRYDISNLPAPMSRGEKLLYKIAVGETDLSDVPGYLSRYEELLKYLIENGGISGGDFEYVLYTLNQSMHTLYTTAEKPVKSAILSGQTLVNFLNIKQYSSESGSKVNVLSVGLKSNTKYIIIADVKNDNANQLNGKYVYNDGTNGNDFALIPRGKNGKIKNIFTTPDNQKQIKNMNVYNVDGHNTKPLSVDNMILCEYQEGMENWDIPYFEGMQSVKMPVLTTTGKNLFDINKCKPNKTINDNGIESDSISSTHYAYSEFIPISDIFTMSITSDNGSVPDSANGIRLRFYDENKKLIASRWFATGINYNNDRSRKYITYSVDGAKYLKINFNASGGGADTTYEAMQTIQIEKGSKATTYEPFKSNILTVNEPIELCGIGDVKDELNCLTGEVTKRIGEGNSENFISCSYRALIDGYYSAIINLKNKASSSVIKANLVPTQGFTNGLDCGIYNNPNNVVVFKKGATLEEIENLVSNLIIQYQLAEESIKTVDLTTVDQDNQPTKLGTFENVTHVSLEAENIIPEVEMEVATRISTELASASPLMDDISTKQEQLETMVDEQSNNVDATMIATTEIYEETL